MPGNCEEDHQLSTAQKYLDRLAAELPYSQKEENARHRCPVCAFKLGVQLAADAAREGDDALRRLMIDAGIT